MWRSCNALRISNSRGFVSPAGPSARRRSDFLPRFSALVNVPADETPSVFQSSAVERKIEQLQGARDEIKELIGRTHCNPILIRLGWHDAGTYDENIREWPKCGGANGSLRFSAELGHEANAGLLNAFKLLLPIKVKFNSVSYADLFQLASATAIELAGGPRIPMKYGRVDALFPDECVKQGNLPSAAASNPGDHLRQVFYRMGFSDQQIVALSGAHTLGRARPERSGWGKPMTKYTNDGPSAPGEQSWTVQWLKFDNSYFKDIKERKDEDLLVLPTDAVLFEDPGFKIYAEVYAQDEDDFFRDYAQAHARLSELGAKFEPAEGIFIDEPAGERCLLLSAGSLHKAFSQISRRIFTGRAKRATEIDVHRTCAVVRQVEQLEGARYEIKKVIERTHCSSILIRLGWHDARTYDKDITEWPNCGGANGSLRFFVGLGHDAGLQNAFKLLDPVKEKFNSISYADLFQLASATAIEMAGGPQIPMKYGRVDAAGPGECQECNLSCGPGDTADHVRKLFYRMGLNDKEIVALLGAHTLGTETPERNRWGKSETNCTRDGSEALGGQSLVIQGLKFDNSYFKDIKERKDKNLPVLPIDAVLFEDPRFKVYAELYAQDITAFFKDYAQAHAKLSELGTKFEPCKGISIDAVADAVTACLEALVYWSLSPLRSKGKRNSPMQRDPLSGFWNGPIGQRISALISCNLEQLLSKDAYFSSGLTEDSVIRWIQDSEVPRLRGEIKEQKTCCCKGCVRLYTRLLVHRRIGEPYHRCLFGNVCRSRLHR